MEAHNPMFKNKDGALIVTDDVEVNKQTQQPAAMDSAKLFKLRICAGVLLFVCLTFGIIMIAAVISLLTMTPFEPVFWLYVFSMIVFWTFAIWFICLSMHVSNSADPELGGMCTRATLSKTIRQAQFWVFSFLLFVTWCCMLLVLAFSIPELFVPTTGLQFQRLAGVTSNTASFFIREPSQGDYVQLFVEYRLNGTTNPFVAFATPANITKAADYTAFVRVTGLLPATTYEWRFQNTVATFSFTTFPLPGSPAKFQFYFGSCFLEGFPSFQHSFGWKHVHNLQPDFVSFIGDAIYSDIPFFSNDYPATYRALHRRNWNNPYMRALYQSVPNYGMWDDHEIRNNWPNVVGSNLNTVQRGTFEGAINQAWNLYWGHGNPSTMGAGKTYFDFEYGDSAFIFLDTRVERSDNSITDDSSKTILGAVQKLAFKNWLVARNSSKFKFVFSPLGFTSDVKDVDDNWGAYTTERNEMFDFIRDNRIEGVSLLTGDTHFAYATELFGAPGGRQGGIYEFSASPVGAFDSTLGGFPLIPNDPWVGVSMRKDRLLFSTIGRKGPISLLGFVKVDTTLPTPEVTFQIHDGPNLVWNQTFVASQFRAWEGV